MLLPTFVLWKIELLHKGTEESQELQLPPSILEKKNKTYKTKLCMVYQTII